MERTTRNDKKMQILPHPGRTDREKQIDTPSKFSLELGSISTFRWLALVSLNINKYWKKFAEFVEND